LDQWGYPSMPSQYEADLALKKMTI